MIKKLLIVLVLFSQLSLFAESHGSQPAVSRPAATQWDVAKCAALAEGTAIFLWYLPAAVKGLGKFGMSLDDFVIAKAAALKMQPELLAGIEMLMGVLGYQLMPRSYFQMGLNTFYTDLILPAWNSCVSVSSEFYELPQNLYTLMADPDYYLKRPYDSKGIATGKSCIKPNSGMFGKGWRGCLTCCKEDLTFFNQERYLPSCNAVCNARFK